MPALSQAAGDSTLVQAAEDDLLEGEPKKAKRKRQHKAAPSTADPSAKASTKVRRLG